MHVPASVCMQCVCMCSCACRCVFVCVRVCSCAFLSEYAYVCIIRHVFECVV